MSERDLRFTKTHEWLRVEDGVAVVGLSDYAQSELGDIVFIELPAVGTDVARDETLTTVESVKSVSELYAPVSGRVVEVNSALEDDPGAINADPYGAGWILKIEVSDAGELNTLMTAGEYEKHLKG
jgi:glycine cleavage system H protein